MVNERAVGALNDVILFLRPVKFDVSANQVVQFQLPFQRRFEANDALTSFRLELRFLFRRVRHPLTIIDKRLFLLLGFVALRLKLFRLGVISIGKPFGDKLVDNRLILVVSLRLIVRRVRTADAGTFVPVDSQPFQAVKNRLQSLFDVALLVGVVNTKNKLTAVVFGEQPVEQSGANAANMKITSRAGSESSANCHGDMGV